MHSSFAAMLNDALGRLGGEEGAWSCSELHRRLVAAVGSRPDGRPPLSRGRVWRWAAGKSHPDDWYRPALWSVLGFTPAEQALAVALISSDKRQRLDDGTGEIEGSAERV